MGRDGWLDGGWAVQEYARPISFILGTYLFYCLLDDVLSFHPKVPHIQDVRLVSTIPSPAIYISRRASKYIAIQALGTAVSPHCRSNPFHSLPFGKAHVYVNHASRP